MDTATFYDCLIETMDVLDLDPESSFPTLSGCLIDNVYGWANIPSTYRSKFVNSTEISVFVGGAENTSSLLDLRIQDRSKIALTILHKVYVQRGSGRRYSALVRGLPPAIRSEAKALVAQLVNDGWLILLSNRGEGIYGAVRSRRAEVLAMLDSPSLSEGRF